VPRHEFQIGRFVDFVQSGSRITFGHACGNILSCLPDSLLSPLQGRQNPAASLDPHERHPPSRAGTSTTSDRQAQFRRA